MSGEPTNDGPTNDGPRNDGIEQTFDALTAAAGLDIPADRRPVMLDGYRTVRQWAAMVRAACPPPAAAEPATVFDPAGIERLSRG